MTRTTLFSIAVALLFLLECVHSEAVFDTQNSLLKDRGLTSLKVENCVRCHENPGFKMGVTRSDGLFHDLYVDSLRFQASIHYRKEKRQCLDCHKKGYDYIPHTSAQPLVCFDCHEDFKVKFLEIKQEALQSVHFGLTEVKFGCGSCHSPHYMKKAAEMTLSEKNAMCLACHAERYNPSGLPLVKRHAWHVLAPLHLNNTACIACHTKPRPGVSDVAFKHDILKKEEATRNCRDCHAPDGKMLKYLADIGEKPKANLSGQDVFKTLYISGATNIKWLDMAGVGVLALALAGIISHGLVRLFNRKGD